jgi:hypothetical protein
VSEVLPAQAFSVKVIDGEPPLPFSKIFMYGFLVKIDQTSSCKTISVDLVSQKGREELKEKPRLKESC